jgi:predicted dinucleotide-binding enzyme
MNIGILATGVVGRSHAAKLSTLGHQVVIGTRDVAKKLAEDKTDAMGNPPFSVWQKELPGVKLVTFTEAAAHGEVVINALHGQAAVEVLKTLAPSLEGKILLDITNPLDFSKGMPPSLFVSNTDSLGEQIQRALPGTKVVKTLNTTNALVQVDPGQLAGGDHHAFVSGNDAAAKARVIQFLKEWYGWKNIIDLGDITTARGVEMILPLWARLWGALQTPFFNIKIVR